MGKKVATEKWLLEVSPVALGDIAIYDQMSFRELVIVLAASNDSLIARMLEVRLIDDPEELAAMSQLHYPLGESSSRHGMAFLLGLIDKDTLEILRKTNVIRNAFAHRVTAKYTDQKIQDSLKDMFASFQRLTKQVGEPPEFSGKLREVIRDLRDEGSARVLLLAANAQIQAHFGRLIDAIPRVDEAHKVARNTKLVEMALRIMQMLAESKKDLKC